MKQLLKKAARIVCLFAVAPAVVMYWIHAGLFGKEKAFPGWSQFFSLFPGTSGAFLRHAFYSCSLRECETDACISFGTVFSHPGASVGRTAYIGNYCSIGDVEIGDDVLIASHVSVMNGSCQHGIDRLDIPVREQEGVFHPVSIGNDTWIGERAIVAANVGQHCVIGAGALVLSPIPDYAIAVGVPARVIRDRRDIANEKAGSSSAVADVATL